MKRPIIKLTTKTILPQTNNMYTNLFCLMFESPSKTSRILNIVKPVYIKAKAVQANMSKLPCVISPIVAKGMMNEIPLNNVITYTKFLSFFSSLCGVLESICVTLAYTFCSPRIISLISLMFNANKYATSNNVKYVILIHLLILFLFYE